MFKEGKHVTVMKKTDKLVALKVAFIPSSCRRRRRLVFSLNRSGKCERERVSFPEFFWGGGGLASLLQKTLFSVISWTSHSNLLWENTGGLDEQAEVDRREMINSRNVETFECRGPFNA